MTDDAGDAGDAARPGFLDLEGRVDAPLVFRLRPSVEVFAAADGDVYLLRPGGMPPVVVRQAATDDRALLERLATEPVVTDPGSEQARRLAPLEAAGLLSAEPVGEALPAHLAERFAAQLPYVGAATQRRLRAAGVTVIGCGGLGTWALAALAGLGIGHFTLVDDDRVEIGNLNRQIVFGMADVGHPKVDRAALWLGRLDPEIEVRRVRERVDGDAAAAAVVDGADAVVLAADWPAYELARWVNRACVAARVPFIAAGQQPPVLKIGPTYALESGPCFACHERRLAAAFPLYRELADYRRDHPSPAATLGVASGVVGTLMALEVMNLLTGEALATRGRALLIDMTSLAQRWEPVERDERCPVCGTR